jgi:hypothetical protein
METAQPVSGTGQPWRDSRDSIPVPTYSYMDIMTGATGNLLDMVMMSTDIVKSKFNALNVNGSPVNTKISFICLLQSQIIVNPVHCM